MVSVNFLLSTLAASSLVSAAPASGATTLVKRDLLDCANVTVIENVVNTFINDGQQVAKDGTKVLEDLLKTLSKLLTFPPTIDASDLLDAGAQGLDIAYQLQDVNSQIPWTCIADDLISNVYPVVRTIVHDLEGIVSMFEKVISQIVKDQVVPDFKEGLSAVNKFIDTTLSVLEDVVDNVPVIGSAFGGILSDVKTTADAINSELQKIL